MPNFLTKTTPVALKRLLDITNPPRQNVDGVFANSYYFYTHGWSDLVINVHSWDTLAVVATIDGTATPAGMQFAGTGTYANDYNSTDWAADDTHTYAINKADENFYIYKRAFDLNRTGFAENFVVWVTAPVRPALVFVDEANVYVVDNAYKRMIAYRKSDGVAVEDITLTYTGTPTYSAHFHNLIVSPKYIILSNRENLAVALKRDGTAELSVAAFTAANVVQQFWKDWVGFTTTTFEDAINRDSPNHTTFYATPYKKGKAILSYYEENGSTTGAAYTFDGKTANGYVAVFESDAFNSAPNSPVIDSPKGTSAAPAIVQTLTPTLDWTFSDPDAGNTQSAYQVIVYDGTTVVHDTLKVASADTFFNVPSTKLAWNKVYNFKVKTWDNSGVEGPFSALEYFKTNRAPTATNLTPGSTDSTTPEGASPTPRLGWTYSDADADVQAHFQVKIFDMATTPALVHDSTKVASANAYYDVPSAVLTAGVTYQWEVTVWDSNALSGLSAREYIIINNPPGAPTATSPADTKRTTVRPIFEATIADDVENDNQHFVIQIADDNAFSVGLQERNAETAVTGWQAKTSIGSFVAFPSGGVDATYEGGTVQYTWQADLIEGKTYYWRIAGIDVFSGTKGPWSATRSVRVGDTLLFQLKTPVITTAAAQRIVLSAQRTVAIDGTTPASFKVEVCNNGLDAAPTWEDATNALLNGTYHTFTNTAKTAADWAVNVRVTVKANDSLGVIEIDGIGFSFD
jgi:hypothetical protein